MQHQLGHSSPMVTLNVYAHLFEDDLEHLYEALDAPPSERLLGPPDGLQTA